MKRKLSMFVCLILMFTLVSCSKTKSYHLTEDTFFLVMTNMQYYPEQYIDADIEFDCFTYSLTDVDGKTYICGVRKCSSGYGCTCGKDTIIGFVLDFNGELPEPKNQSEDTNEKTWVHLKGTIKSAKKTNITIHSYLPSGDIDPNKNETIVFLNFKVNSFNLIDNYSNLSYYVTK